MSQTPADSSLSTGRVIAIIAAVAAVLVFGGLAIWALSSNDSNDSTTPTTAKPLAISDPISKGDGNVCKDQQQDITIETNALIAPPVPAPWVDVRRATLHATKDTLTGTMEVGAAPNPKADAEYVTFVGLPAGSGSFEIHVIQGENGWFPELHGGPDLGDIHPLTDGRATVEGHTITFTVPMDQVPIIRPDQPISYGATAAVVDAKGRTLDAKGKVVSADAPTAAQVFDECPFYQ